MRELKLTGVGLSWIHTLEASAKGMRQSCTFK